MKVLAADGISPKGIELLQKDFEVVVKDKLPAEELLEIIPDFDALIVRSASCRRRQHRYPGCDGQGHHRHQLPGRQHDRGNGAHDGHDARDVAQHPDRE